MERSRDRGPADEPSEDANETASLVSCFWCDRLHWGKHPLSVCPACKARFSILRSLAMKGPYPLDHETIDALLIRTSPGNYALGYMDGAAFVVFYVGRSDCDVRQRLHDWVGSPSRYDRFASAHKAPWDSRHRGQTPLAVPALGEVGGNVDSGYTRFAYSYAPSAEAAFAKEWRNFGDFGGSVELDNKVFPTRALREAEFSAIERA